MPHKITVKAEGHRECKGLPLKRHPSALGLLAGSWVQAVGQGTGFRPGLS